MKFRRIALFLLPIALLGFIAFFEIRNKRTEDSLRQESLTRTHKYFLKKGMAKVQRKGSVFVDGDNEVCKFEMRSDEHENDSIDSFGTIDKRGGTFKLLEQSIVATRADNKDACDELASFLKNALELQSTREIKLRLLSDNSTIINEIDDSMYSCLPDPSGLEKECVYHNTKSISKMAKDDCLEYKDIGDEFVRSGHSCPLGVNRSGVANDVTKAHIGDIETKKLYVLVETFTNR
jgi:hypothetical protein